MVFGLISGIGWDLELESLANLCGLSNKGSRTFQQ